VSRLYVYAILGGPLGAVPPRGVLDEPLRVVECGDVLVAVGETAAAPPLGADALRGHDTVVRRLAGEVDAILQARFGSVVADEDALRVALEPRLAALGAALRLVRGCEQMTLRVFGPPLGSPSPSEGEQPTGPGARYLAAVRQRIGPGDRVAALRERLGGLVAAERFEPHATPPLVASVYHLVPRHSCRTYLAALDAAAATLRPSRVSASGPWPPYAFVPEVGP
jgi:hypothetical protein